MISNSDRSGRRTGLEMTKKNTMTGTKTPSELYKIDVDGVVILKVGKAWRRDPVTVLEWMAWSMLFAPQWPRLACHLRMDSHDNPSHCYHYYGDYAE